MSENDTTTQLTAESSIPSVRFAANDVRLSVREWMIAVTFIVLACWLIPWAWQIARPCTVGRDYRLPFRLGNDYWTYEQMCRATCDGDATLLVGDSVLWGHYVGPEDTLSHYLTEQSAGPRFANLAVDGIHPTALSGLVKYYGSAIRNKRVVINCNLLWMSSPRHDLTSRKEASFNHPALVPQFATRIPSYKASVSDRLGIVLARHVAILSLADHQRIAFYDNDDLATWTMSHPAENPLQPWARQLPTPAEPPSPTPDIRAWTEKMIRPLTPDWVPLDESLQWRFFRRTVQLLQQRGNRVYVIVGPLNEYMLTEAGLAEYERRKQQVIAWHKEQRIPFFAPVVLPTQVYADMSHPLAAGYAQLATDLLNEHSFRDFLKSEQ